MYTNFAASLSKEPSKTLLAFLNGSFPLGAFQISDKEDFLVDFVRVYPEYEAMLDSLFCLAIPHTEFNLKLARNLTIRLNFPLTKECYEEQVY